jgi:glutamine amidotransferase
MFLRNKGKIVVINSGLGNIGSLTSALEFLDFDYDVKDSFQKGDEMNFDGFILPGVGSFPRGMQQIKNKNLDNLVYRLVEKGVPGMGICLGMQLLAEYGYEGGIKTKGLNLFDGYVEILPNLKKVKIPNIGWRETKLKNNKESWQNHLNNIFYYIHSYFVNLSKNEESLATIKHGDKLKINVAMYKNKLLGVQFHPEKSQQQGLELIREYFNFHI